MQGVEERGGGWAMVGRGEEVRVGRGDWCEVVGVVGS